jgi:hypothetical protein
MKIKQKIFFKTFEFVSKSRLAHYYELKNDDRPLPPFKLVFFCGSKNINYLNASLISVYKNWKKLPELCIVSDGSPVEDIRKNLVKWPREVEIVSWQQCANYFKEQGNQHLYAYACNELLGKKLVGIMYCGAKSPILYSDSDVLWFNSPKEIDSVDISGPQIKMCHDIGHFYTEKLLQVVNEEKCLANTPFNSGVIYLSGEFSSFPKWAALCEFLGTNKELGWFSEQTSFAILKNHFKPAESFRLTEVLIKVDDEFSLRDTRKLYPDIFARHYVNKKSTTFWRDFVYMFFKRS